MEVEGQNASQLGASVRDDVVDREGYECKNVLPLVSVRSTKWEVHRHDDDSPRLTSLQVPEQEIELSSHLVGAWTARYDEHVMRVETFLAERKERLLAVAQSEVRDDDVDWSRLAVVSLAAFVEHLGHSTSYAFVAGHRNERESAVGAVGILALTHGQVLA